MSPHAHPYPTRSRKHNRGHWRLSSGELLASVARAHGDSGESIDTIAPMHGRTHRAPGVKRHGMGINSTEAVKSRY